MNSGQGKHSNQSKQASSDGILSQWLRITIGMDILTHGRVKKTQSHHMHMRVRRAANTAFGTNNQMTCGKYD